jgi:hypothetical protein
MFCVLEAQAAQVIFNTGKDCRCADISAPERRRTEMAD